MKNKQMHLNIGFVSHWFNRGQATVTRYIKGIFDELGYSTYVLIKPTKGSFSEGSIISYKDVWNQKNLTEASGFDIPINEYTKWVKKNNLDIVFFDQNYQFDEIKKIRNIGVKTIGRFVWESFDHKDVEDAKEAFDCIYSLTKCEQERYNSFGIDSPYLNWGCHPEIIAYRKERFNEAKKMLFVGGFMSIRKPTGITIEAFKNIKNPNLSLLIKSQRKLRDSDFFISNSLDEIKKNRPKDKDKYIDYRFNDKRISSNTLDLSLSDYYNLLSDHDILLAPSRWEGLGLHLYESIALGIPIITSDIAPINELIVNNYNGILVKSNLIGYRSNGIPAYEPDLHDFEKAIKKLTDQKFANEVSENAKKMSTEKNWNHVINSFKKLIDEIY
jgi:1,2-diacylglycerol 3-alpha-glucosyltransferase